LTSFARRHMTIGKRVREGAVIGLALAVLSACGGEDAPLPPACDFDPAMPVVSPGPGAALAVDGFRVALGQDGAWTVTHADEPGREVFRAPGPGGMAAIRGALAIDEGQGAARVTETIETSCPSAAATSVRHDGRNLVLSGPLGDGLPACAGLSFEVRLCEPLPHHLSFEVRVGGSHDAVALRVATDPGERVLGLGGQFLRETLDLAGRVVPIVVREQGIGRGEPVISPVMEALSPGSSGDETTAYHPVPHVVTSRNRSFFLEGTDVSVFDLSRAGTVEVRSWSQALSGRALHAASPLEAVERFAEFAGRMREPPAWLDGGAVVALASDLDANAQRLALLRDRGAAIAAVWDQTWCGTAKTLLGEQVLWNWALPPSRSAAWNAFAAGLEAAGIRPLCYVNPMFRDLPPDADPASRNLYREVIDSGFAVRRPDGTPYLLKQGMFEVVLLDLSSGAARTFMKSVLKDELLSAAGCSGWMADFGEALPFDAVLASGEPPAAWHSRYPVEWARLNREALEEAGALDATLVFHRSGFTATPAFSGMQWEGDQAVTWDAFDGMASGLHGLLNGGFSGISLNHSDAGGYTAVPVADPPAERSPELLARWVEMNAFTALLRTHEGNRPDLNAQVYSTDTAAAHFARFSRIFRGLGAYRRGLFREAAATGAPVVRHVAMHFPDVPRAWDAHDEFLLGPDVLVAPVLEPSTAPDGSVARTLWLPPGRWRHLWTGVETDAGPAGFDMTQTAPPGEPPVYLRAGAASAEGILDALRAEGITLP
jgi:alpha-glucosidase